MERITLDEAEKLYRSHPWTVTTQDGDSDIGPIPDAYPRPTPLYDRRTDPEQDRPTAEAQDRLWQHCVDSLRYVYVDPAAETERFEALLRAWQAADNARAQDSQLGTRADIE